MSELKHIGVARRSGRYPWGSGEDGYQRNAPLKAKVNELRKSGFSETQIAEDLGFKSTSKLRSEISLERAAQRKSDAAFALRLKEKGYSNVEIGKRMNINESSVRSLLNPVMQERALITEKTAEMLKQQIEEKKYIDVGAGVENQLGITRTKLNTAISDLENNGYKVSYVKVEQLGTGNMTSIKVLTKADVPYSEIYNNKADIQLVTDWSNDGGKSYNKILPPINISKDRVMVRYAEEGGKDQDGVLEIRRGVEDLSLGGKNYAQVRIAVDGTHYLKGMAFYADDLPEGVDIRFNTNKPKGTPMIGPKDNTVLKPQEVGKANPFNSEIKQNTYLGKDGQKKLSAINIVNQEGDWDDWSRTLSSQVLSKQAPKLAKQQLDLALKQKQEEFDEYISLTNPTVKKQLLEAFGDDCDSSAVHLKAAAMPRQSNSVILPSTKIKPTEIYATKYKDGEKVVLIRHPHGGIFEIPELMVNNKNPDLKAQFGDIRDAVIIHPEVAKKLSGADFDGDTVLVIPNRKQGGIATSPSLAALKDFDPKEAYPGYTGMKRMTAENKQMEMGKISNLITDMTIKGANNDEIARAVRHSMVVIDAEKHNLNYRQSFIDNGIAQLKATYQGGATKGASTIVSRAKSEIRIDKRKDYYKIDKLTGKKIWEKTEETYGYIKDPNDSKKRIYVRYPRKDTYTINPKTGKKIFDIDYDHPYIIDPNTGNKSQLPPSAKIITQKKQTKSTLMYETEDAFDLSSGTGIENIYAEYANSLKRLGDRARKEAANTPNIEYSPSARKTYAPQVESLMANLYIAKSNSPLERKAQLVANKIVSLKKDANPDLTTADLRKIKGQALAEARNRVGARKQSIKITPLEWEAIQAGAISNSVLTQILANTNMDLVKQYATPRSKKGISAAKLDRAKAMFDRGYTQSQIADALGVSTSTLMAALEPIVVDKEEGD